MSAEPAAVDCAATVAADNGVVATAIAIAAQRSCTRMLAVVNGICISCRRPPLQNALPARDSTAGILMYTLVYERHFAASTRAVREATAALYGRLLTNGTVIYRDGAWNNRLAM